MSKFAAGKEVISYCTKCKLPLAHIIVSMKDSATIGKVICNTCKSTHVYKDPSSNTKKVKGTKTRSKTKKTLSVAELWTEEIGKADGKAKDYTIRGSFEVGDLLNHKKFGPGIVQSLTDDKVEVLFQHEIKLLVHNK